MCSSDLDVIMLIATCFGCTLYYFYAFSGTTLLTRCHSTSSRFCCFWFQKSCSGNILGIGRHESQSPYFSVTYTESGGESKRGSRAATPRGGVAPLDRAAIGCGPPGRPPMLPFRLFIPFLGKTLNTRASIHEKFRSRRRRQP